VAKKILEHLGLRAEPLPTRRPRPRLQSLSCSLLPEPHPPPSTTGSPTAPAHPQQEISTLQPHQTDVQKGSASQWAGRCAGPGSKSGPVLPIRRSDLDFVSVNFLDDCEFNLDLINQVGSLDVAVSGNAWIRLAFVM
jgi:hypothetical protein